MNEQFIVTTSFQTGELDPLFEMRVDTGAYNNALKKARNVQLLNGGGWMRRPGTYRLAALAATSRLEPFIFDSDEVYLVCFYDTAVRIYSINGTLLQTITGAPWTAAQLWDLSVAQLADTMVICHQSFVSQVITRTSISTFALADFAFVADISGEEVYQPYYKYANAAVTIKLSATTGAGVTITAAGGTPFTSDWVGTYIKWFDTTILITAYSSTTVLTGTVLGTAKGLYDIDPFKTTNGSAVIEVTHALHGMTSGTTLTISGADSVGGLTAANINGSRVITVIDDNHYSFPAASGTATSSVDGGGPSVEFSGANIPTRKWEQQSFSDVTGYPRCVCFYESRMWLASTPEDPSAIWSSKISQFFNFDVGDALDTDSIQVTVGSNQQIAEVIHLVPDRDLNVYTMTGEYYAPKQNDSSLTPSNFQLRFQTPYGASAAVPRGFDGATIFVQDGSNSVREFLFVDLSNSYNAPSISFVSSHLLNTPKQIAVMHGTAAMPEQYAYFVNTDGTMAVFLSARSEKITGWSWFDAYHPDGDALFISAAVIDSTLYVVTKRDALYFLEKFDATDDITIDCATTYTSDPATNTWVVSTDYANETVDVMSGDLYLGAYAVDGSGNLVLDFAVETITVGYNYTMHAKSVPPRIEVPDGTRIGMARRIVTATVHFNRTLNCKVNNRSLITRTVDDDLSIAPAEFTGKKKFSTLGYSKDPVVEFTQTAPQRCRVLGMTQKVLV